MALRRGIITLAGIALLIVAVACRGDARIDPSLVQTEWTLVSLNGDLVIEEADVTLHIEPGDIGGHAGCNTYGVPGDGDSSTVMIDGRIQFPDIVSTAMACASEDVMTVESRYLSTLKDASRYHLEGDQLRLETDDDRTLVFQRSE